MAIIEANQSITITLDNSSDIEAFRLMISEICTLYAPPQSIGFKQKSKFKVDDAIGAFAMGIGMQIGLFEEEDDEEIE
jgi:DhnA family fructose-bisphosphate aldolase class Ia